MSGGYCYGQEEPLQNCPYCDMPCHADFVDIGVGYTQCGPYHCDICGASEIGPYDSPRELSDIEKKIGWYAPNTEPGSSANVIDGKVVTHRQMKSLYFKTFINNPLYDDEGYVENWYKETRAKKD